MATTKTLQDFRNVYYAILKENEDSSAYPLALADVLINNSQRWICSWNLTDLTTWSKEQIEKWPLPFLFSDKYYTSVQDTYVANNNLVIGGTTIECNSTIWYSSTWFLWINEDIVQYTWTTATTFTWVTGIEFAHIAGARISQLYELPTDFASSVRVIFNNQVAMSPKDYRNLYLDLNDYKWTYWVNNTNNTNTSIERFTDDISPFYTIINWLYFIPFQIDQSWYMIHMIYEKAPTTLTAWTDITTIPDEYSEATIPFIAASDTLYNRWEETRALSLLNFWLGKVMEMYSYYANVNNEDLNGQRTKTWKDMYLNI